MTVNRGLFVRNNGTVGTTPAEGRLVLAELVAENAPGVPRQGLLDQKATQVVTGTASTSPMSYDIAACTPVINRAANEGVYIINLTGTTNVTTTAAPASGSRWDLIYVKQNDTDKGDANNLAVAAVLQGTASSGTPTKPYASLPAGALVLAEAQVSAGATTTNGAQVAITQAWNYTAHRGTPIPVRTTVERDGITTPVIGLQVKRLDLDPVGRVTETWNGSAWDAGVKHVEFVRQGQTDAPANTLWGPGAMSGLVDSAVSRNYSDWLSYPQNDAVTLTKEGLYAVSWKIVPNGTVSLWHSVSDSPTAPSGGAFGRSVAATVPASDGYWTPTVNFYVPPAGQTLHFKFSEGTAGVGLNHRIRITKLA